MVVVGTTGPEMIPTFVMDLDVRLDLCMNRALRENSIPLISDWGDARVTRHHALALSGLLRELAWKCPVHYSRGGVPQ